MQPSPHHVLYVPKQEGLEQERGLSFLGHHPYSASIYNCSASCSLLRTSGSWGWRLEGWQHQLLYSTSSQEHQFQSQVFMGSKPGLFAIQVNRKSLHFFECLFFFLNAKLVCNTEPIEFIPQNSEHNWAFVFNRWISHMPEGVTRRRDWGRKEEMQFGVEGGGVRGGISNRVTLKRNASYPCKDLFWSAPMSLKLSLSECTENQAAHRGI